MEAKSEVKRFIDEAIVWKSHELGLSLCAQILAETQEPMYPYEFEVLLLIKYEQHIMSN
ncbi:hypothetical protein LCGC14_0902360 [marine sediment metagenome]|uniref:Uncharacterized protein n=1 Tax=marine sediment metagenome TaxID=412755 RepID=A0A0F9PGP9_9ZZZZ